jgi:hypothetical protein
MAIQKHNRSSERTKDRLVRGIDPIPENWELASGYRALQSLARSRTTLKRLLAEPAAAAPSDFRSVLTAVERARAYISGGFPVKEIEPLARMWGKLQRKTARTAAARRLREARP